MKKLLLFLLICITAGVTNAQKKTEPSFLAGKWIFVHSSERNFGNIPGNQLPELTFNPGPRTVSGFHGCNKTTGSYAIDGDQLTFGTMVTTNKACTDMEVEKFISHFLINVGSFKIEDGNLYLYDKTDKSKFLMYRETNNQA